MKRIYGLRLLVLLLGGTLAGMAVPATAEVTFEALGAPSRAKEVDSFPFATTDGAGNVTVWTMRDIGSACAMIGINTRSGKSTVIDFTRYGRAKMALGPNGAIYIHTAGGAGGRFFRYDPAAAKLTDLGVSSRTATYMLQTLMTPEGIFYVPTYPGTEVNAVDTKTDRILKSVKVATDVRQKYITGIQGDRDGVIYLRLGLDHPEIWSYQPAAGTKKQLLPETYFEKFKPGDPELRPGNDGGVYLKLPGGESYRCFADRLEKIDKIPPLPPRTPVLTAEKLAPLRLNSDGELELAPAPVKPGGAVSKIKTDTPPIHPEIYSVSCESGGWLYGGTIQPAAAFRYRPDTGEKEDLGRLGGGAIQIYDLLPVGDNLFISSYTGGHIDTFNTKTGEKKHIGSLTKLAGYERIPCLILAPNRKIYGGAIPVKAKLGGAIIEIDPATGTMRYWKDVIPKLSIPCVAPVKASPLIFAGTSTSGGTSAIPEAKEACVLLFDPESGKAVWQGNPLPGETGYHFATATPSGLICGIGASTRGYYLFDPATRQVTATGKLPPEGALRLCRQVLPDGRVIGVAGNQLFAIDPTSGKLEIPGRHPSLGKIIHQIWLSPRGELFYGSEGVLWRARFSGAQP
ncbi:MAG: hypothetical protein AB7F32_10125 [Victivallaceae bacterium]